MNMMIIAMNALDMATTISSMMKVNLNVIAHSVHSGTVTMNEKSQKEKNRL